MSGGSMETNLLFVYGTLMKEHREDWQRRVGAHFVGRGRIIGKLYDLGGFPGAVISSDHRSHIRGEVYRLDDVNLAFEILDEYEEFKPSNPARSLFVRKRIPVRMEDGKSKEAWVYVYNRRVKGSNLIHSGDYRQRASATR